MAEIIDKTNSANSNKDSTKPNIDISKVTEFVSEHSTEIKSTVSTVSSMLNKKPNNKKSTSGLGKVLDIAGDLLDEKNSNNKSKNIKSETLNDLLEVASDLLGK